MILTHKSDAGHRDVRVAAEAPAWGAPGQAPASAPSPLPLSPALGAGWEPSHENRGGEGFHVGAWPQGGGRFAPLPWATVLRPSGAENPLSARVSVPPVFSKEHMGHVQLC
jgi:hypothetical protein